MQVETGHSKLTYDDLLRLPDDGLRHEIIDGEHYVTPAGSPSISGSHGNCCTCWCSS